MSPRRYQKQFLVLWPSDRLVIDNKILKELYIYYLLNRQEFDEDELEAELDALGEELELEEQEELDKQLLDVGPATARLPDVPRAEPAKPQAAKAKKEEEDPDMAELAAWAS